MFLFFPLFKFDVLLSLFLGAPTHLYIRSCLSVGWSVGWSVKQTFDDPHSAPLGLPGLVSFLFYVWQDTSLKNFVHPFVHQSVTQTLQLKLISFNRLFSIVVFYPHCWEGWEFMQFFDFFSIVCILKLLSYYSFFLPPFPILFSTYFLLATEIAFLVADTQLYKRLCPSVRRSIRWSVRGHESKSGKTSILDAFYVWVGCGWRMDAPAHPSATILWPRVTCCSFAALNWNLRVKKVLVISW